MPRPIIQGITRFMRPVNYLGLPALSVPAGFGQHGMPIGLQLIGRPFGEETLTALGSAFQARPTITRRRRVVVGSTTLTSARPRESGDPVLALDSRLRGNEPELGC